MQLLHPQLRLLRHPQHKHVTGCAGRPSIRARASTLTQWPPARQRWWPGNQESDTWTADQQEEDKPSYGCELTTDQWNAWDFDPLRLTHLKAETQTSRRSQPATSPQRLRGQEPGGDGGNDLPRKLAILAGLVLFSRLGVYIPLPGVDVAAFADSVKTEGLLGYIDTLSGGSISRVGIFSLGIVPYINASIVLQLLQTSFPSLKEMQTEGGSQGRNRFKLYQQLLAFAFALVQGAGQLLYLKSYVPDFDIQWFVISLSILAGGAMLLVKTADVLGDLKLGNGTSILITANIASALPSSVGAAVQQAASKDSSNLVVYALALFITTLGVVYVQEAERKIPMNYASRYRNSALSQQSYLPFKVNATGVMPVIFASTLMSLPTALGRNVAFLQPLAVQLSPTKPLFLPANIVLIAFFNYYYTFLQLEPKEMAEQLKRQGASIPGIRPGRATAEYVTATLQRMSILGSAFLAALSAAPTIVELLTKLQAFRGFAGTSILILVGVATDTARRVRAEQAMSRYGNVDKLYDDFKI